VGRNTVSGSRNPAPAGEKSHTVQSARGASIKHDRTGYAGQMPRVDSPFDASVFRSDEMIGLALRQMQPALGLKHVMTLSPWILRAKRESYAVECLSLEQFCSWGWHLPGACHRRIVSPTANYRIAARCVDC
jgi:hypothetical protein